MGLAVVNGQLYAVGGFDGTTYLKNVETFDQEVITRVLNIFNIIDLKNDCGYYSGGGFYSPAATNKENTVQQFLLT